MYVNVPVSPRSLFSACAGPYTWEMIQTLLISVTPVSDEMGVVHVYLEGENTPVLRGSNLFGQLTWTERRQIQSRSWLIAPVCRPFFGADLLLTLNQSYKSTWIPEIKALQAYSSNATASNITSLMLMNYHSRLLGQRSSDRFSGCAPRIKNQASVSKLPAQVWPHPLS